MRASRSASCKRRRAAAAPVLCLHTTSSRVCVSDSRRLHTADRFVARVPQAPHSSRAREVPTGYIGRRWREARGGCVGGVQAALKGSD
eukprot:6769344-Prymnesium_polylepis.1